MLKRRGPSETGASLLEKLQAMAAAHVTPLPAPPPPSKPPRYQLAANFDGRKLPPLEAPPGVPAAEWREAQRNVQFGSAPSTIKKGSNIPSDWTMRRNGFA